METHTEPWWPECRARLYVFPGAGGTASAFRNWAGLAGDDLDVIPVQYPGRETRLADPPHRRIGDLADEISAGMDPGEALPRVLLGHSMGATVAFEVARRLEAAGAGPALLVAIAAAAPHLQGPREPVRLSSTKDLADLLRRLGGTDEEALDDEELLQLMLPAFRADFSALENYECSPQPPLRCPITAITAAADSSITPDQVDGWRQLTEGGFGTKRFRGGHFFLWNEAAAILQEVRRSLADASSSLG